MIMMMTLSSIISVLFIMMNHPLSMGLILLFQTIMISLISGLLMFNFWFSYILFLIMVGGMLILFIYMTSIASNEKFKYSNKITMILLISFLISLYLMFKDKFIFNLMNLNNESLEINNSMNLMMSKFINWPNNILIFMLIIYLFITLIAVVKIADNNNGPLRQKN
uniref:NADH-ubiquinone oxidoreductase chain 6 n=1 Tax=Megalinus hunanensis TaxID=2820342 RepID=A0A8A4YR20_9COLE|nr:NADH dehydrogenase subunit 6 [Megalinus hunanensis]QTE20690.1 NADH dehydrogenase subunit 6 [Megalinus hunanensis]